MMRLVAVSWKNHPEYPLIISTNRDEFFTRPTKWMHRWESGLYTGKDLRSGGTWLGFHPNENYGTVSSTAVLRHRSGLKERTFDWDFHQYSDQEFQFKLNKPIETL